MRVQLGIGLAYVLISTTTAHAQSKPCSVPTIRTVDNQVVNGKMTVKTGHRCNINMGVSVGGISDARIVHDPKHGAAQVIGYRIVYTPKKGFTGKDQFTYSRNKLDIYGNKSLRTVNVQVDVKP